MTTRADAIWLAEKLADQVRVQISEAVSAEREACAKIIEDMCMAERARGNALMREGFHPQAALDREAALSEAVRAIKSRGGK